MDHSWIIVGSSAVIQVDHDSDRSCCFVDDLDHGLQIIES